jgi:hypothetical protein
MTTELHFEPVLNLRQTILAGYGLLPTKAART